MEDPEHLKCPCKECGNNIEFPAAMARDTIACPHCGQWTELPSIKSKEAEVEEKTVHLGLYLLIAGVAVLAAGGFFWFHNSKPATEGPRIRTRPAVAEQPATKPAATNVVVTGTTSTVAQVSAPSKPKSLDDLKVDDVKVEKTKGSSLKYATGKVKNDSEWQRFGVKIELDLLNSKGEKISTAQDYKSILEPHQEWQFRALIPDKKAVKAVLSTLKEQ